MYSKLLDIPFRDNRDYLHGTDIYRAIIANVAGTIDVDSILNLQIKFRQFTSRRLKLEIFDIDNSQKCMKSPVSFKIKTQNERKGVVGCLSELNEAVTRREKSNESAISQLCTVDEKTVSFCSDGEFSPIDCLVFATKFLHTEILPKPDARWIFAALDITRALDNSDIRSMRVTLESVVRDRFTECYVVLKEERVGSICFNTV